MNWKKTNPRICKTSMAIALWLSLFHLNELITRADALCVITPVNSQINRLLNSFRTFFRWYKIFGIDSSKLFFHFPLNDWMEFLLSAFYFYRIYVLPGMRRNVSVENVSVIISNDDRLGMLWAISHPFIFHCVCYCWPTHKFCVWIQKRRRKKELHTNHVRRNAIKKFHSKSISNIFTVCTHSVVWARSNTNQIKSRSSPNQNNSCL